MKITLPCLITIMGFRGSGKSTLCKALINFINYDKIIIFDMLNDYVGFCDITVYDSLQLIDAIEAGKKRIRLVADGLNSFEVIKEINDYLFIYDESDALLSNQYNPESFSFIVNYGRHFNQSMILIARRPQALPREFTAQSVLFFRPSFEPRDNQYIMSRIGKIPSDLPPYNFYCHSIYNELEILTAEWILKESKK